MGEEFRRAADKDDHDSLIQVQADMKYLCKAVQEIKNMQMEQTRVCSCRMRDCSNFFVSSRVFNAVLAIAILIIGSVSLVSYQTKQDLAVHQTQLSHRHEDQTNQIDSTEYLFRNSQADELDVDPN